MCVKNKIVKITETNIRSVDIESFVNKANRMPWVKALVIRAVATFRHRKGM